MPDVETKAARALRFEPPGPGSWMLDTTHHGRRPITPFLQGHYESVFVEGMTEMLARYGLPIAGFRAAYVHGCSYVRPVAVGEPEKPRGEPPRAVLWLLSRLHPELRRRRRTAAEAWAERRWRADVDAWFDGGRRAAAVAANRSIQAVEPAELDDHALLAHLDAACRSFHDLARVSFATHGGDLVPTGDYFAHCTAWDIDAGMAASLLAGASPASLETATLLAPVARATAACPTPPTSVDEVRALGPEVAEAVDGWLADHGWRLLFSDDLDSPTLQESPELVLRALLGAGQPPTPSADPEPVRQLVPSQHRAEFDERLAEARYGLRLRDDNVGIGWNWPAGLVRRAALEAGRRLAGRDHLQRPEHVLALIPEQVGPLLLDGSGPTASELAEAWAFREVVEAAPPPLTLGPEGGEPPFDALPAPLARAARALLAVVAAMEGDPPSDEPGADAGTEALTGTGIGDAAYQGRARIALDAATAMATLEVGDVVVTRITGPAWNSLLPSVGALVVEAGGPLSHAAIVAREFGIPAVIGVPEATHRIPDGAAVEVDPSQGTVRVL